MTNQRLTRDINVTGGLPTYIDNALNIHPTCVDLEGLFLVRGFEMRFWMGSIPKFVDLDNKGSTLRIIDPHPYLYPLRLIKGTESMEKGARNMMIKLHHYSVESKSKGGGKKDQRVAASTCYM